MAEQIGIADKNSAKSKELEKRIEEMQGQVSQNEKECTQYVPYSGCWSVMTYPFCFFSPLLLLLLFSLLFFFFYSD